MEQNISKKLTLATERSKKSIRRKEPTNSTDLTLELLKESKAYYVLV
jgi:urease accessory protein UreE